MDRLGTELEDIQRAAALLRSGLLVGIPTETVYGLAGTLDPRATAAIYEAKDRPRFDPLIVHIAEGPAAEAVGGLVTLEGLDAVGRRVFDALTRAFWPGPLTLVLPRGPQITDLITAGLPTVAVRMPRHPVAQRILVALGAPVVAPSANRFGGISPTCADDVIAELTGRAAAVVDAGSCVVGVESTVLAIDPDGAVRSLRPGGIPQEAIVDRVGPLRVSEGPHRIEGPGQTSRHYAPTTEAIALAAPVDRLPPDDVRALAAGHVVGVLRVLGAPPVLPDGVCGRGVTLSASGDLVEAAQCLFAALRDLDRSEATRILVEPAPTDRGLGRAIADRLRRATAR